MSDQLDLISSESIPLVQSFGESSPPLQEDIHNQSATLAENSITTHAESNWLKKHLLKISLGAFVVGSAVTIATNPLGTLEKDVFKVAPWAVGGIGVTETMWIGGAAMMAGSAGKKIGNPLTLKSRFGEVSHSVVESPWFRTGLAINTAGALGTAGVAAAAVATSLPAETWPGAFAVASGDMVATVAVRSGIYASIRESNKTREKEIQPKPVVRHAQLDDMGRLADIDLQLFDKAYGANKPTKEEVVNMLTQRFTNNPNWMFVAEVNGEIEGFVTGFLTNTPAEKFTSWENSTNNGTLNGKVESNGRYVYVVNMTIKHKAVKLGAEDMLLAQLFANGIKAGAEYGYFVSRMPLFRKWLNIHGLSPKDDSDLSDLATEYAHTKDKKGKRIDPQLRMYEDYGFELSEPLADGFEDAASMNFGIVCKAYAPTSHKIVRAIKPLRWSIAAGLRQVAKHPKLLKKVL